MNVNELRTELTNMQMSFERVVDQIAFSNAEVRFHKLTIKDVVYEEGAVQLYAFELAEK